MEAVNAGNRFEREEFRRERQRQDALDREINALIRESAARAKIITEAVLLVAGYHKHKGQWRRKRGNIGQTQPVEPKGRKSQS